jgi:hypothetical protein
MLTSTPFYYTSLWSAHQTPIPNSIQPQQFPTIYFKASTVLALLFACTSVALEVELPGVDPPALTICLAADVDKACRSCRYNDEGKKVRKPGHCGTKASGPNRVSLESLAKRTVLIDTSFLVSSDYRLLSSGLDFHFISCCGVGTAAASSLVWVWLCGWMAMRAVGKCNNATMSSSFAVASAGPFVRRGGEHTLSLHL